MEEFTINTLGTLSNAKAIQECVNESKNNGAISVCGLLMKV